MVLFDTSVIVAIIDQNPKAPLDPQTQLPLLKFKERVEFLIETLSSANETIIVPTPVLSEFLVKAGPNRYDYVTQFHASRHFQVVPFDERSAIELALLNDPDLNGGKRLDPKTTWAKVKLDRQIVAIAKTNGASRIYAGDIDLATCARNNGIQTIMTWELPEPPIRDEDRQVGITFKMPDEEA